MDYLCCMKLRKIKDAEWGIIVIRTHAWARHVIYRIKSGQLTITAPPGVTLATIRTLIEQDRDRIKKLTEKRESFLQVGEIITTRSFTIHLVPHQDSQLRFSLHEQLLTILCPTDIPIENPSLQRALKKGICRFLHQSARTFLPQRAEQLSRRTNAPYSSISISHGRQRLGKCDIRGNIWLSYYLMLLPDRLIDYVICHELAHLSEMNHSKRFHQICNRYCDGQEKILEKELKQFVFSIS